MIEAGPPRGFSANPLLRYTVEEPQEKEITRDPVDPAHPMKSDGIGAPIPAIKGRSDIIVSHQEPEDSTTNLHRPARLIIYI